MRTGVDGQVVHIVSVHAAVNVEVDAADTILGHQALPDFDTDTAIRQLEALPQAIDELIARNLNIGRVLQWATRDDDTIRELIASVDLMDPSQLTGLLKIAFGVIAAAGHRPDVLETLSASVDQSFLSMTAAGASFVQQNSAVDELDELLSGHQPEQVMQDFFEKHPWMFGSRFVGRWPGRQITLGDQQDFILRTADGFFDLIELKLPTDDVLRFDSSHQSYYPSSALSMAIGQVQKYLLDIDNDLYRIRTEFGLDVHRARAVIVIGQFAADEDDHRQALRGLNSHLSRIEVWTYTQVLAMARTIVSYTQDLLTP